MATRSASSSAAPTAPPSPAATIAFSPAPATSPSASEAGALSGYQIEGDDLTFVFDEEVYGLREEAVSVAVAGNFNEWENTAPEWQLRDDDRDGVWTLEVPLGNGIRLGAAFLFVVDGQKLQPPAGLGPNDVLPDGAGGLLLVLGGLADLPAQDEIIRRLERRSYADAQGDTMPYYLLTPADYESSKVYPLVVFLHGSGERGDSLAPVLPYNGAYEFIQTAQAYSYFMLIPQAPDGTWWDYPRDVQLVLGLLEDAREQFLIDPDRMYITGLSMGAFGMWRMVSEEPNLFAAGISVAGGLKDLSAAPAIAHIPFRVFHGTDDSLVAVTASRATVDALQEAGGAVEYVEYEGEDHWIWARVYTDSEVIDWLFAQEKQ
jgi:poly(3-hydroxybutyrate) depolymerase